MQSLYMKRWDKQQPKPIMKDSPASPISGNHMFFLTAILWVFLLVTPLPLHAEELKQPLTPVFQPDETQHGFSEFQSLPEIPSSTPPPQQGDKPHSDLSPPINTEQPPKGVFYQLDFAKDLEDDEGMRRGHFVFPINPTSTLPSDGQPIYLVFQVHSHFASYEVFGQLYPEHVTDLSPDTLLDEDAMHLALEDDSGYLQFDPPTHQWPIGTYRVKIFVGFEASQFNLMGTMRFSVIPASASP